MSISQTVERRPPPYAPYRSWKNLIDKLRGKRPLPAPFDSGFWNSLGLSGGMISVQRPTMVSLDLLDASYAPTDRLNQLLDVSGDDDAKSTYKEMLDIGYPGWEHKLDIERATGGQLTAYLNELGATGDTVPKCKSFFIGLAKDAGLDVSPHLNSRSSSKLRSRSQTKRPPQRRNQSPLSNTDTPASPPAQPVSRGQQEMVELSSGGTMTLILDTNVWQLSPADETFLLDIKHRIRDYNEAKERQGQSGPVEALSQRSSDGGDKAPDLS